VSTTATARKPFRQTHGGYPAVGGTSDLHPFTVRPPLAPARMTAGSVVRCVSTRFKPHEGQRGLCFVRPARRPDRVTVYVRSSGFCVDPVENKPLNHFLPARRVSSFAPPAATSRGKFCRTDISIRGNRTHSPIAPRRLHRPRGGRRLGCRSVGFTVHDPTISGRKGGRRGRLP